MLETPFYSNTKTPRTFNRCGEFKISPYGRYRLLSNQRPFSAFLNRFFPNVVPNGGGFGVGGKGGRRRLKTHSEAFGSFDLSDGGSLRQCQCSKPSCMPRLHCSSEVRNQTNTASECPEMREAHLPCEGTSPIPPVPTTWSI